MRKNLPPEATEMSHELRKEGGECHFPCSAGLDRAGWVGRGLFAWGAQGMWLLGQPGPWWVFCSSQGEHQGRSPAEPGLTQYHQG